ncbi:MAG TPA: ribosome maturation factor RimM [Candidatus Kapabacteria bacterium]|nr:ribosome maturation factor RimM [Candidatus Kapabacteria bacterium]
MEYKYIGTIVATRGYSGEMKVSDLQLGLIDIKEDTKVKIGYSLNFSREFTLKKWRQTNKAAKVEIKGIKSDKDANDLIESGIFVLESDILESKYSTDSAHKLIGYNVINYETDELFGVVTDVLENPAHEILIINRNDSLIPIPFVKEYIKLTDNVKKEIDILIIDGIEELGL